MFNAANWANPSQYSDITTYSGLDDKKGMMSLEDAYKKYAGGVEPPNTGASSAPVAPPGLFANISNTASQLGQGNFSGAAKSLGVQLPKLPTLGSQPNKLPELGKQPAPVDHNMSSDFEG
jgi:hypothetical protein